MHKPWAGTTLELFMNHPHKLSYVFSAHARAYTLRSSIQRLCARDHQVSAIGFRKCPPRSSAQPTVPQWHAAPDRILRFVGANAQPHFDFGLVRVCKAGDQRVPSNATGPCCRAAALVVAVSVYRAASHVPSGTARSDPETGGLVVAADHSRIRSAN